MIHSAVFDYRISPSIYANTGGPASRTRKERIASSLLGQDNGAIRCPRIIRLGLKFKPRSNPLNVLDILLKSNGYTSPEDLRSAFDTPTGRLICRPCKDKSFRIDVASCDPRLVLEQALLLGLCTADIFDPSRPVLWTQTSVTRALELYDPSGFYACA